VRRDASDGGGSGGHGGQTELGGAASLGGSPSNGGSLARGRAARLEGGGSRRAAGAAAREAAVAPRRAARSSAGGASSSGGSGGNPRRRAGASRRRGRGRGRELERGQRGAGGKGNGKYPFPQNQKLARCTYPTDRDGADVQRAYDTWKSELVTADGAGGNLRVSARTRPGGETNSTVSEGIAYGMMLAVHDGGSAAVRRAVQVFAGLAQRQRADELVHQRRRHAGSRLGGATDADERHRLGVDPGFAQWGGSGSLAMSYLDLAKTQIDRIWKFEVSHDNQELLLPGDAWSGNLIFNPRTLPRTSIASSAPWPATPRAGIKVIDTGYTVLEKSLNATSGNATTAWSRPGATSTVRPRSPSPVAPRTTSTTRRGCHFRIGVDYCISGEPRAAAYLAKIQRLLRRRRRGGRSSLATI
jgi:hypothetical protein